MEIESTIEPMAIMLHDFTQSGDYFISFGQEFMAQILLVRMLYVQYALHLSWLTMLYNVVIICR